MTYGKDTSSGSGASEEQLRMQREIPSLSADELDAIDARANAVPVSERERQFWRDAAHIAGLDPQTVRRLVAQARLALSTPKGGDAASTPNEDTTVSTTLACSSAAGLPSPGGATSARAGEDDVERVAREIVRWRAPLLASDERWPKFVASYRELCAGWPEYEKSARALDADAFRDARAARAATPEPDSAGRVRGLLEAAEIVERDAAECGDIGREHYSRDGNDHGLFQKQGIILQQARNLRRAAASSAPREAGREFTKISDDECRLRLQAAQRSDYAWKRRFPDRWKQCPSTHCERSQECRSPDECSAKVEPPAMTGARRPPWPEDVEQELLIQAAANIIDVMSGGDRSWRDNVVFPDCLGSTFLESADWQTALAYARAALSVTKTTVMS